MLEYEKHILIDLLSEDGLIIGAKGLGLENIFVNLLVSYADAGNLVLVIGTNQNDEEYFISRFEDLGAKPLPKTIKSDSAVSERSKIYMEGGILFVTSRILVTDLLREKCPAEHITGIIVWKAHTIIESCQEAFILRLFRQKNKKGFIKAFSSSPLSYTLGFCQVERIMKNLFIKNLVLLPRFHMEVSKCLNERQPEVIELHLLMTPDMIEMQKALVDLINVTLQELKLSNRTLDIEEFSTENALAKSFEKMVKIQLEPIWNQLSVRTKQLIADMKILRTILVYLCQYDCITFYNLVMSLRTTEKAMASAGWMMHGSADTLFVHAKQRVFGKELSELKLKNMVAKKEKFQEPKFEVNPKWVALSEALDDIKKETKDDTLLKKCLIVTQDDRTTRQLKEYLCDGSMKVLRRIFYQTIGTKYNIEPPPELQVTRPKKDKGKNKKNDNGEDITLTQINKKYEFIGEPKNRDKMEELESPDCCLTSPLILIQSFKGYSDHFYMTKTLEDIQPKYIIMYDIDLAFIRQVEVWQASKAAHKCQILFLIYKNTVEEQIYLTNMKREKDAFEFLIKQKSAMVLPEYVEGRNDDNPDLSRDPRKPSEKNMEGQSTRNTRKGEGTEEVIEERIIVDIREFRSELPALIHKRGIEIEPATIEVGDYILTPDICVERKSISDLIGSLNSGRLYNQAVAMTRCYKSPILLIEFDPNKSFHLQGKFFLSSDNSSSSKSIMDKLQLLTIHFPHLRILWCPSPYATAELFHMLKNNKPQPSLTEAQSIASDSNPEHDLEQFNPIIKDFISKLPGITTKNIYQVLRAVKNLPELLSKSNEELKEILQSDNNAAKLYKALHGKLKAPELAESSKGIKYTKKGLKRFRN